jgi:hypothetical protein
LKKTGDKAFIRQLALAKNTEEAFEMITKKAATIKDPLEKAAFASAAFSRAGIDMLKFMEAGPEGIKNLRQEARKYGAVISNEAAANSELFIDAMTNFKAVLAGVGLTLGSKLMPFLTKVIQRFADFWAGNRKLISQGIDRFISLIGKTIKTIAPFFTTLFKVSKKLFRAFLEAISAILPKFSTGGFKLSKVIKILIDGLEFLGVIGVKAFEFIKFASPFLKPFITTLLILKGVLIALAIVTKGAAVAQGILNAVMTANPIGLIVVAIAALVAGIVLLIQNWDIVVLAFQTGVEKIKIWFNELLENNPFLKGIVSKIMEIWNIVVSVFKTGVEEIKIFFSAMMDDPVKAFKMAIDKIWGFFSGLLDNPFFAAISTIFLPFITIPALIVKHWEPVKEFFNSIWSGIVSGFENAMLTITGLIKKIENIPGVKSVFKFLGIGGDEEKPKTETRAITPQERLSRKIEETTNRQIEQTENNSILTIKDETGRGELSPQKKGFPQIALSTSGGL